MPDPRRTYSTLEVAQRLGVSTQTVQRWVDAGHLKAWKTLGGHRRIEAESAEHLFRAERAARGESAPGRVRVLIVDDSADDREILVELVQRALPKAEVTAVDNGFQGLVAVGQLEPHILVADIVMPYMDGIEMLRHLATRSTVRPRHIAAVSSHSAREVAAMGVLPEGVTLLAKPVARKTFTEFLQEAAAAVRPSLEPPRFTTA